MIKYCMKVAVCDDEPKTLQSVASMTREIAAQDGIDCELTLYESSLALQQAIQNGAQYHVLLLDVLMDELGGMERTATLRRQGSFHQTVL
ncbi:MAG: response regulator transcription factor [Clostridia bacterium]|nr:response regulator transcription factor [Clostridia bacterium]